MKLLTYLYMILLCNYSTTIAHCSGGSHDNNNVLALQYTRSRAAQVAVMRSEIFVSVLQQGKHL